MTIDLEANKKNGRGSFARCVTFTNFVALPAAHVLRVAYSVMIFAEVFTQHATRFTQMAWPESVICKAAPGAK